MGLRHKLHRLLPLALLVGAIPPVLPQALAFPHQAEISGQQVWSERPIDHAALGRVLARRDKLIAASPIAGGAERRRIFLTRGGWRWHWLSLSASGAFAITRPLTENIVVNSSDIRRDRISNGSPIAGTRSLSAVLAHETAHGMLRRRYGITVDMTHPQWLREGYCDHVARESSLSAEQAAQLEADGIRHPALPYFHGRQRVARLLQENGGSVDALFGAGSS